MLRSGRFAVSLERLRAIASTALSSAAHPTTPWKEPNQLRASSVAVAFVVSQEKRGCSRLGVMSSWGGTPSATFSSPVACRRLQAG